LIAAGFHCKPLQPFMFGCLWNWLELAISIANQLAARYHIP
jgi:hypothetical protein